MQATKRRFRIRLAPVVILTWIAVALAIPVGLLLIFFHFVLKYW